jgi:hypothetical protein
MTGSHVVPRRILALLVGLALLLPIVVCVLAGVGRLLAGMGDAAGATALDRLTLAVGLLWAIDLIALLIANGVQSLGASTRPQDEEEP